MERKPKGIETQGNQVEKSKEAELALHKIFGQVAMSITPKTTLKRLFRNATNGVPLTPEWEAFRDGALEVAEKSDFETKLSDSLDNEPIRSYLSFLKNRMSKD